MLTFVGLREIELMAEPETPETIDLDSIMRNWLALSWTLFLELLLWTLRFLTETFVYRDRLVFLDCYSLNRKLDSLMPFGKSSFSRLTRPRNLDPP